MSEVNSAVPAWLERIVARLHEKEPSRRFESAAEVAALLEQCLAHVQQPSSIPLPAVVAEPAKPRRWLAIAAATGAAAIVLALLFAGRPRDGERKQSAADEPRAKAGATGHAARLSKARDKQTGLEDDAIAAQIDRANESARRLESDVGGPPTIDEVIESELNRVDRGLRLLEADVLESLGNG